MIGKDSAIEWAGVQMGSNMGCIYGCKEHPRVKQGMQKIGSMVMRSSEHVKSRSSSDSSCD